MGRRPFCVASVILIAGILLLYRPDETELLAEDNREKVITGQVEEIAGDGESIVVTDIVSEDNLPCNALKVYQKSGGSLFQNLKIGNLISLSGTLYCFEKPGNPGQFNEYQYYLEAGIDAKFFVESLTIKNSNYKKTEQKLHEMQTVFFHQLEKCLPGEETGIIAAMILGNKSSLSMDVKQLYQKNGIAHILAISGLHISLIGAGLFFVLRRFVMPMKGAAVTSALILVLYGELTGFSVSTTRAVLMMCCMLLARFVGRRYDLLNALAFSACIQLLIHPASLYQSGFLLSYGTVLGIALFVPVWESMEMHKPIQKIWNIFAGNIAISLITFPILLYFYFEINCYSAFVNLLILPFLSFLLLFSISGGIVSFFSIFLGKFLFGIVHYVLCYYHWLCEMIIQLPGAVWTAGRPELWKIVLYYCCLALWILIKEKTSKHPCVLIFAVILLVIPIPKGNYLQITNLDVGQGDCACVQIKDRTILIDGGSSSVDKVGLYRIQKYLKYYGISKIDYVFLTHSDSDHINGVTELLEEKDFIGIEIETVVLPKLKKVDKNCSELEAICKRNAVPVRKMERGDFIELPEGVKISCLHPYASFPWQTENNYSLVLEISYGTFTGLLTGDLEQEGEKELINLPHNIDYLKVSHHGSKGASGEEFLSIVKPKIAVISAGKGNRYGHPAKETIARLQETGAKIYSTIEAGAVTVSTDGRDVEVRCFRNMKKTRDF